MKLTKAQREQLRMKYGGRCAYCGCELEPRKWHADHIQPLRRYGNGLVNHPERDTLDNLTPACSKCNNHKFDCGIEEWRRVLQDSRRILQDNYSTYRMAIRYGLVVETDAPVVFYFEKCAGQQ